MEEVLEAVVGLWSSLNPVIRALLILVAGWAGAFLSRLIVGGILSLLGLDKVSEKIGAAEFLRKGNVTYSPSKLGGNLAYWITFMAALFQASKTLDIEVVNALSDQLAAAVPSAIAAGIIVAIGAILMSFVSNFALTIARNAALPNSRLLARTIKYGGNVLVVAIALDQVGLGRNIVNSLFTILFGAAVFGLALAFGLGCKDMAREAMARFILNLKEKERLSRGTDLEG
ncbi:MAG: hypothetical protein Q8M76_08460 [Spirochaetaceae bacterium]|nr:hypothetical protein [Spirochaetaceae bacterium]